MILLLREGSGLSSSPFKQSYEKHRNVPTAQEIDSNKAAGRFCAGQSRYIPQFSELLLTICLSRQHVLVALTMRQLRSAVKICFQAVDIYVR